MPHFLLVGNPRTPRLQVSYTEPCSRHQHVSLGRTVSLWNAHNPFKPLWLHAREGAGVLFQSNTEGPRGQLPVSTLLSFAPPQVGKDLAGSHFRQLDPALNGFISTRSASRSILQSECMIGNVAGAHYLLLGLGLVHRSHREGCNESWCEVIM